MKRCAILRRPSHIARAEPVENMTVSCPVIGRRIFGRKIRYETEFEGARGVWGRGDVPQGGRRLSVARCLWIGCYVCLVGGRGS